MLPTPPIGSARATCTGGYRYVVFDGHFLTARVQITDGQVLL